MTIEEISTLLTEIVSENSRTNLLCLNTSFPVIDKNSDGIIEKLELKYRYSIAELENIENETNQHINKIIKLTNGYDSNEEKIKIIYDYFIDNFVYDDTYESYDIYSLFTKNKGTCCSFALGFKEILDEIDIPCKTVVNKDMSHEWNQVYVNNEWLNLDITRGLTLNSTGIKNARYRCFLVNDLTFLNWGYDFKKGRE